MNKIILTPLLNKNLLGKKHINSCLTNSRFLSKKFEIKPCNLFKLDSGPALTTELTKDDALLMYRQMKTIRKLERSLGNLYLQKKVRGFCHLYSGQEACAVGMKAAMRPQDTCITAYRCHGWMILMDATHEEVIAELLGRSTGSARGKGGSMHMYSRNFYGGNGIVGAHVPLGVGIAFAHKYNNSDAISVTVYGDGASNQGQVFEVFNMSKLWNLPVIYACENNRYALGTSLKRHAANPDTYKKGDFIPGISLDGMDVLAVREGTRFCVDHIKTGKGPIILEMDTYRYHGHSMSDSGMAYRTRKEVSKVKDTQDPIRIFRNKVTDAGLAIEDEFKKITKEIKKEIADAVEKSLAAKVVPLNEIAYDVYKHYPYKIKMPAYNHYIDHKNVKASG